MAKFTKKANKGTPGISTASLPDIIFMLLFFFMVVTVMRQTDLKVKINKPDATETEKLENKSLVDYINIGPPSDKRYGTEPRIQLDDAFATPDDIGIWVKKNREKRRESERPLITTSLKVDRDTKMGIVTDVKLKLRDANALKLNYSTNKKTAARR